MSKPMRTRNELGESRHAQVPERERVGENREGSAGSPRPTQREVPGTSALADSSHVCAKCGGSA